jgi:hypothetical protein
MRLGRKCIISDIDGDTLMLGKLRAKKTFKWMLKIGMVSQENGEVTLGPPKPMTEAESYQSWFGIAEASKRDAIGWRC